MENRIKTVLLLAGMTAFLILMGRLLGGRSGMYIAFILALAMNFFSYCPQAIDLVRYCHPVPDGAGRHQPPRRVLGKGGKKREDIFALLRASKRQETRFRMPPNVKTETRWQHFQIRH